MKIRLNYLAGAAFLLGTTSVFAQTNPLPALNLQPSTLTSLTSHYPWACTVLLVIGALRVLFKPVMALLDAYIKDNCSPEEYGRLQHFEAGPIYKWVSFVLDFAGSIKLPVIGIKPNQENK